MAKQTPASDVLIINVVEISETRVENHKLQLPVKITGREDDTQRAVIFHAAAVKLETPRKHISTRSCLDALASIVAVNHNCDYETEGICDEYYEVFFDPSNWTILSFHNFGGTRLNNFTTQADPQILKTVGSATVATAAANRREADIAFVIVMVEVDLSGFTGDPTHKFRIESTIALPRTSNNILDGNNAATDLFTFGDDDICTYTPEDFKREVLERTGQTKPVSLLQPTFGRIECTLDETTKDD